MFVSNNSKLNGFFPACRPSSNKHFDNINIKFHCWFSIRTFSSFVRLRPPIAHLIIASVEYLVAKYWTTNCPVKPEAPQTIMSNSLSSFISFSNIGLGYGWNAPITIDC